MEFSTLDDAVTDAGTQRRVLIVDDESHVLNALKRVLRPVDCEVDTAASASDALRVMAEKDYHLIISDLKMPETDGIELLTLVSELYPQTSRMLLSGHAERGDLNNAINQCRVDQYLDKPWDNQQLISLIEGITSDNLRERQVSAENRLMDAELNKAMKLQQAALPAEITADNLHIRWMFKPCHRLGGDGFNYWVTENRLHFYVVDVAGHGVPAAMESFAIQQALNNRDLSDPAAVTASLNDSYLFMDEPLRYCTLLAGCLDLRSQSLTFCQAGHPGPLLVSRGAFTVRRAGNGGFPVGLIENAPFDNQHLKLEEDDLLILHSDGLAEAGAEDFEGMLLINSDMQPHKLTAKVIDWRSNNPIDDDISALFITVPVCH